MNYEKTLEQITKLREKISELKSRAIEEIDRERNYLTARLEYLKEVERRINAA